MSMRNIRNALNMMDRPINKGKTEVSTISFNAFAYLFSEIVQYSQTKVTSTTELEQRLETLGIEVGCRLLELLTFREKNPKRRTRLIDILKFIHSTIWPFIYGKTADSIEQANNTDDEFMISDQNLALNKYISVPKELATFNPGAFMAGIIKGVLDSSCFPARVSAHNVQVQGLKKPQVTFLMKFEKSVIEREAKFNQKK